MMRWIRPLCGVVAALSVSCANADPANAIMRLLNSQASGSVRGFEQAAEEVAEQAKQGRPVYAYVLALVSRMPSPPPAARLDDATRTKYLDGCRDKIKKLANEKNNSMAWYLLSLENNDRDLLHRAADAGNVQAMNAWGTYLVTRAVGETADTNEVNRILGVAHDYFKSAAGQGDANGLYNLGMCHLRGLGTPQDDKSAFNCFRSAAEKEHPEAINNIGLFFREGSGSRSPRVTTTPTASSTSPSRSRTARAWRRTRRARPTCCPSRPPATAWRPSTPTASPSGRAAA